MNEVEARLEYGKVVVVEIDGHELLFRPLKPSEAERAAKLITADVENAVETSVEVCRNALLSDPSVFDQVLEYAPLMFSGEEGIIGELLKLANSEFSLRVKTASSLFKRGERNYGLIAENLLAFKAYQGGDYTAKEMAGALHIAEWMSSTKGIFLMFQSLLKALSKKR